MWTTVQIPAGKLAAQKPRPPGSQLGWNLLLACKMGSGGQHKSLLLKSQIHPNTCDLAEIFEEKATSRPPEQQARSPGVSCWTMPLCQLLPSHLSPFRKALRLLMAPVHSKILVHHDYRRLQSPVPSEI